MLRGPVTTLSTCCSGCVHVSCLCAHDQSVAGWGEVTCLVKVSVGCSHPLCGPGTELDSPCLCICV